MKTIGSTRAWQGGRATECAQAILAPNPSPMTLDGTNTWLLQAPGERQIVVVDPGPDNPEHLAAVLAAAAEQGEIVEILLTHGHADHSAGAAALAAAAGVGVRALDPAHRLGSEGLAHRDVIVHGSLEIEVVATPGHSSDSLTFWLSRDRALLTGDTIIGRGTTVVAHPDGRLAEYLESLALLEDLVAAEGALHVLPGHGPSLANPGVVVADYIEHREQRLNQVRSAVEAGAMTVSEVVAMVYADLPRALWPAAELSVKAQLDYLGL